MNAIAGALGFMPAADPTAYTNQVKVSQQATQATTALDAVVGLISAYSVAMNLVPGEDADFLKKVNDLNTTAQAASANASKQTPAQIAKTTSDLTTALTALQTKNAKSQPAPKTQLQTLQDGLVTINNRIDELQTKGTSSDLLQPYLDLQKKTKDQIIDLTNLQIQQKQIATTGTTVEHFQDSGAQINDPIADLLHLDSQTRAAIDGDISAMGIFKRVVSYTGVYIYYALLTICFWLGGTATSNTFHTESFPVKIWYFIYGAILFQVTMPIYGILFPPKWQAKIIPLIQDTNISNGIIKELFGHIVHGAHSQTGGATADADEDADADVDVDAANAANAPAKAVATKAVATKAPTKAPTKAVPVNAVPVKKPTDERQVLRYLSLAVYIAFQLFYFFLQKYF